MNFKTFLRPILFGLTAIIIVSCDKDFDQLGTDIVGGDNEHFGSEHYSGEVSAFNQALGPISSNNLAINPLGFYKNSVFGDTQANFVTQLEMASINPTFNNTDATLYNALPVIDSVILNIPYFSHVNSNIAIVDNKKTYILDSIHGTPHEENDATLKGKFKLRIYESNYYLRDFDPGQAFGEQQLYYTDQDAEIGSYKIPGHLNDSSNSIENDEFYFDKREHKTSAPNSNNEVVDTRSVPAMRLHLNKSVFYSKILNAPSGQLADNVTFKNYFRGLYFETTSLNVDANMAMINFQGGTVTIYYQEDKKVTTTKPDGTVVITFDRVKNKTFVLNLKGNSVSLLKNTNVKPEYAAAIQNNTSEQKRLYIKGGEGSIATIDLFGNPGSSNYDTYSYEVLKNTANKPIDENGNEITLDSHGEPLSGYLIYKKTESPNGIADKLDDFRYPPINDNSNQIYHSKKNRMMINEANLTFYIDQDKMLNDDEPNRIYLYDLKNSKVLADYAYDFTTSGSYPKYNKYVFSGIYLNDKGNIVNPRKSQKGIAYRIKITNHIRNLIKNDSTNVRLGLGVTENINNIIFSKRKSPGTDAVTKAPSMSVMNPLGTVLYGTGPTSPDLPEEKKLKLEIYYTKPKTN